MTKELSVPKAVAFPSKWKSTMSPEELETRREQLDRYFTMLISWGERNGVPLLHSATVQQFVIQPGDLPAPDLPVARPRLQLQHLLEGGAMAGATAKR